MKEITLTKDEEIIKRRFKAHPEIINPSDELLCTLKKLQELNCDDLIIAWSETLEEYVLMVTHFGTSWDYVLTDIEPTTILEEADL